MADHECRKGRGERMGRKGGCRTDGWMGAESEGDVWIGDVEGAGERVMEREGKGRKGEG